MQALLLGLAILLSGCASTTGNYYTNTVHSWQGGNVNDLTRLWGRPDRYASNPDGSRLYLYRSQSNHPTEVNPSPAFGVSTHSSGHPVLTTFPSTNRNWNRGVMSQTCSATFLANRSGTITNTDIQGAGCFATEDFAARLSNPKSPKRAP